MIHQAHGHSERRACARKSRDERDPRTMKAKMLQIQPRKKKSPLSRGLERKFERVFFASNDFRAKGLDNGRHRNGIGFLAATLRRGKVNGASAHVDLARLQSRFAQAASSGHGNRPAALHPQRLFGQGRLNAILFLNGDLGFLGGIVLAELQAVQNIAVSKIAGHGLVHDALEQLDLSDGGVPADRLSRARTGVLHAPFEVVLPVLVTKGARVSDFVDGQKSRQMTPAQFVALQTFSLGHGAQPLRHPHPTIGKFQGSRLSFKVGSLCGKDIGLFGVGGTVVSQTGVFTAPSALDAGPQLPVGRTAAAVERGHVQTVANECSKAQAARTHFTE